MNNTIIAVTRKNLRFKQLDKALFDYQAETGNMETDFINDLFPKMVNQRRRGLMSKEEFDNTILWIEEICFKEDIEVDVIVETIEETDERARHRK